jgi:hypothetical protein
MKNTQFVVVAAGLAVAFGVGKLTAQPQPAPAAPKLVQTAKQQQFLGDLNAALKSNHDIRTTKLLSQAAADSELSDVVIERLWNYEDRDDPKAWRTEQTLQTTFAAQQRQQQTTLLQEILVELKKKNANN